MKEEIEAVLKGLPYKRAHPTGSRFICDPPILNTDVDIVIWADMDFEQAALRNGWVKGDGYENKEADTYRKGEYNLIVHQRQEPFYRWIGATYVAKCLNLLEKGDRVMMFEALIDFEPFPINKVF